MATHGFHQNGQFTKPNGTSPSDERYPFERRSDEARIIFNKTIEGHYRNRGHGYSEVASLFVTWESDDLNTQSEVQDLSSIFKNQFNYTTDCFQIPSESPIIDLTARLANFVRDYGNKDNLIIVYYGGHGFLEEDTQRFMLAARERGNGDVGDPIAYFNDILYLLKYVQADVLLIVDSCFAASAFTKDLLGRRKFELLTSCPPDDLAPPPKSEYSFTRILIETLKTLTSSESRYKEGFSTSVLYREVFHHPKLSHKVKPMLFDQSQFDYGRIWLRRKPQAIELEPLPGRPTVSIDLRLNLCLTKQDERLTGAAMNELAHDLRYLRHVDSIDFQELHAGDNFVQTAQEMLRRASRIKRVINNLKKKTEGTKLKREERKRVVPGLKRPHSFYEVVEKSDTSHHTQDWSDTVVEFSTGKIIPSRSSSLSSPTTTTTIPPCRLKRSGSDFYPARKRRRTKIDNGHFYALMLSLGCATAIVFAVLWYYVFGGIALSLYTLF